MSKPIKQRRCVGCYEISPQHQLVRFVLVDGVLVQQAYGSRGAWLHPKPDCIAKATARSAFARSFRSKVDDRILRDFGNEA